MYLVLIFALIVDDLFDHLLTILPGVSDGPAQAFRPWQCLKLLLPDSCIHQKAMSSLTSTMQVGQASALALVACLRALELCPLPLKEQ